MNALDRPGIEYNSVMMSKNAFEICYESSTIFRIVELWPKF